MISLIEGSNLKELTFINQMYDVLKPKAWTPDNVTYLVFVKINNKKNEVATRTYSFDQFLEETWHVS